MITPAPTVLPPSRSAKRMPASMPIARLSSKLTLARPPGSTAPSCGMASTPVASVAPKKNCGAYPLRNGV